MTFVLKKDPTFLWPVEVELADDSGDYVPFSFKVCYRRMTQAYARDVATKLNQGAEIDLDATAREIIAGWDEIKDDSGEDVKFTAKALDELLKIPTMSAELVGAWINATAKVKEKN